jgi:uncharacterized repeat protein (TIGR02543 family)
VHPILFGTNPDNALRTKNGDGVVIKVELGGSYEITYDLDGGVLPKGKSNPKAYGLTDITLVEPTKQNYIFAGWTSSVDGQPEIKTPTKNVTIPAGSTGARHYLANWIEPEYTIQYIANDVDVTEMPANQYKMKGEEVVLSDKTPLNLEGRSFVKWNTDAGGKGTDYYPGDRYKKDEDLLLYAIWEEADTTGGNYAYDVVNFEWNGTSGYTTNHEENSQGAIRFNIDLSEYEANGYLFEVSARQDTDDYSVAIIEVENNETGEEEIIYDSYESELSNNGAGSFKTFGTTLEGGNQYTVWIAYTKYATDEDTVGTDTLYINGVYLNHDKLTLPIED